LKLFEDIAAYIVSKVAVIKENKSLRTYENKWAGELVLAIMDSGTARNCVTMRSSFIQANGFTDEKVAKMQANQTQTFNKLLASMAQNVAMLKAVCVRVILNPDGTVWRTYNIPVDKVERTTDGRFLYNHTKNTAQYNVNYNVYYDPWIPGLEPKDRAVLLKKEMRANNGRQKGTFAYHFNEGVGEEYYAIPPAYSGIEDIKTDGQLSAFELECLLNGFVPSAILTTIGKMDDTIVDAKTGLTAAGKFAKVLGSFRGVEGKRAALMWLTAATKEEIPNLQQLDMGALLDGLEKITDRIGRKVCRLFGIPPILAGYEDSAILGNSQSFKNAMVSLQHSVVKDKELITECMTSIYPKLDFTIGELQLVNDIPDIVLEKLTDTEIRALGGYGPVEEEEETVKRKRLLNILSTLDPVFANELLRSLTEEEKRALIGLKPKETEQIENPDPEAVPQ